MIRPNTNNLYIIQDALRNPQQLPAMIKFVEDGGVFDMYHLMKFNQEDATLIEIAVFPDGRWFVHNGHHRVVAIALARPGHFIMTEEYYVKFWKYEDYMDIVFHNPDGSWRGYVTPFDVRTESRLEDIGDFKSTIKRMYENLGAEDTMRFIIKNGHLYKKEKTIHNVKQLAAMYRQPREGWYAWAECGFANVNDRIQTAPNPEGSNKPD